MFKIKESDRIVAKTVFPVDQMEAAAAFYQAAGFVVERFDANYAIVIHEGEEILHLRKVDELERATNAAAVYMHVRSADEWHARWTEANLGVSPVVDEKHGMREFNLRDPSANFIRVGHNI